MLLEFTVPVTPGQAFTFSNRFTLEEKGTGSEQILEVLSPTHRVSYTMQNKKALNKLVSRRDFVADTVWKRLALGDGSDMFLLVSQRKSTLTTKSSSPSRN